MAHVSATLNYVAPASARNRLYVAPDGHMVTTKYAPASVDIVDGRPFCDDFTLDTSGFALLRHASAVTDFDDTARLDRIYTEEVRQLIQQLTGADHVVPVGWVMRRALPEAGLRGAQPPASVVHVDAHPGRGDARMEASSPFPGRPFKRAIFTSLWRAFSPPPQDHPLALLDYRSVGDAEGVPNLVLFVDKLPGPDSVPDVPDADSHPGISLFLHRPEHRWWYFPDMLPDEVLLFKLHDTDRSVAWRVPHTSFRDTAAVNAHPRESVEFRTVAYTF